MGKICRFNQITIVFKSQPLKLKQTSQSFTINKFDLKYFTILVESVKFLRRIY